MRRALLASLIPLALATSVMPQGPPPTPRSDRVSIWSGVYTVDQARRGKAGYDAHCLECHAGDLDPSNPVARLIGDRFMDRWREESLGYLFHFVSTSMPRSAPASLTEAVYLDIAAFLLETNGLPAGREPLSMGRLEAIRVERKSGAAPLPGGALVIVVGCLTVDPDETWTLTRVGEPGRTRTGGEITADELRAAAERPPGELTFRLANMAYLGSNFRPLGHIGHKMVAKGTLIRQINRERINLMAMKMVDSDCER